MANTPFKLKGWSGYQNSPITKKVDKQKTDAQGRPISTIEDSPEYKRKLQESKTKLIAEERANYKAGKITKKELNKRIKEISGYVDF